MMPAFLAAYGIRIVAGCGEHPLAGEESTNFGRAHFRRMARVMEEDEPFDPTYIGLFGMRAEVPRANRQSNLIEKLWFWRAGRQTRNRELRRSYGR